MSAYKDRLTKQQIQDVASIRSRTSRKKLALTKVRSYELRVMN